MEAIPSLGNRPREHGAGAEEKAGEAGDSGRGWIVPSLGSKNSGFFLS